MRKFYKIISLVSALFLTLNITAGCGETQTVDPSVIVADEGYTGKGTHTATVTPANGYFVKNGKTEYTIVIPKEAKKYELQAAELVNQYTQYATGVTYPVVTDDKVKGDGKYISIGETALLHENAIAIPLSRYRQSGFRVVSKGEVTYLAGARSNLRKGTFYAAQEFLKYTIGFKAYCSDEVHYDRLTNVKALNFDVVEIPEFDNRRYGVGNVTASDLNVSLLRMDVHGEGEIPFNGHSHFQVLPPETYFKDHPDWYWYQFEGNTECEDWADMFKNGQLCLSNQEMITAFCNRLVELFREYPEANFVHLGMQDSITGCECKNCKAKIAEHNTNFSGLNIMFMNQVARTVEAEIQRTEPERELTFEGFAYFTTLIPPAEETNGVWKEHCAEVIPDENVTIQFAPLGYNTSEILDSEENKKYADYLRGWDYLTSIKGAEISVWNYATNFNWLVINHKNWDTFAYNMRYYSEHGVTRMYDQGFNTLPVASAFTELRAYCEAALMWNTSLNFQTLAEEFIAGFYGDAAPYVQMAFDVMTTYYEKLFHDGLSGNHRLDIGVNENNRWTFSYVESQRKLYEKAFSALESLKMKDSEQYEKYYWRVCAAYMENMFMQMDFYMQNYSKSYITKTIDLFEAVGNHYGVTRLDDGTRTLASTVMQWRGANV